VLAEQKAKRLRKRCPLQVTSKITVVAWIISLAGTVLWIYGYYATGNPSFIDWHTYTPWGISDFLPNVQSEIGMALAWAGTVLVYWPPRRQ